MTVLLRRTVLLCAGLVTAGCAAPRWPAGSATHDWSGRLAMQVDSDPPQSLTAGFDLTGSPDTGELRISSPLGTTLATLRWRPGHAELLHGTQSAQRDSLDALTTEWMGASLPVAALFGWLRGVPEAVDGWTVDLSGYAQGRLTALRHHPAPAAHLRIVFQP
ncbi:MAG: lipoprotein insertase outer membrane protein LolB [Hydrogenophaga sp.]